MSKRIPALDLSWLLLENRNTPMHVGGLLTFKLPEGAPADYLQQLAASFREQREFVAPWNLKVSSGLRGKLVPRWVEDRELDLDHHFRHTALPHPGGERELGVLISELHSTPLDLSRPLWELHLIEGLAPDRFALYLKIHHSLIDGVSVMRLLMGMMSEHAEEVHGRAIWTFGAAAPAEAEEKDGHLVGRMFRGTTGVAAAFARPLRVEDLVAPFTSPRSPLSAPMNGQRRFATKQVPLAEIKAAAKATDATVNDIVLWLCSTVLQRYLEENGALPEKRLTAAVPVNLRDSGDFSVGTNIGHLLTDMATDERDPEVRLQRIKSSIRAAKDGLQAMPEEARYPYTLLATTGIAVGNLTRLDTLVPPMFSLVVSNVPGPQEPRYLAGARLEAVYPISLLMRGGALNITVVSLDGMMNFGFVGARDALPHLQRLSVHLDEAMAELKELTGTSTPRRTRTGSRSRGRAQSRPAATAS
jgi:diacylglycerol O-acyltransferase / wax synthase